MKKSIIGVFCLIFVLLVFMPSCKKKVFDITGTWNIHIVYAGTYVYDCTVTFAGSETSGMVTGNCTPHSGSGLYTVSDGETINFTITWPNAAVVDDFVGTKSSDTYMSGTLVENPGNTPGTWTASR